jgi:hypothetical protein
MRVNTYNVSFEYNDGGVLTYRAFYGISEPAVDRYTQYFWDTYEDVSWTILPSNNVSLTSH